MGFAAASMKTVRSCYIDVIILVVFCNSFMAASATNDDMSTAVLVRVDQTGNGDYTKIQDAIDAVPSNNSQLYFIWVKPGTYRLIGLQAYSC